MPRLDLLEAPALPQPVRVLVQRARSRLLLAEAVRRSITLIGAAAGVAAAIVAVGRFVVLPWAEPVAAALVLASLLAALVISLIFRASPSRAALAVDRRLGGYDRVTTALELANVPIMAVSISAPRRFDNSSRQRFGRRGGTSMDSVVSSPGALSRSSPPLP